MTRTCIGEEPHRPTPGLSDILVRPTPTCRIRHIGVDLVGRSPVPWAIALTTGCPAYPSINHSTQPNLPHHRHGQPTLPYCSFLITHRPVAHISPRSPDSEDHARSPVRPGPLLSDHYRSTPPLHQALQLRPYPRNTVCHRLTPILDDARHLWALIAGSAFPGLLGGHQAALSKRFTTTLPSRRLLLAPLVSASAPTRTRDARL